MSVKFYGRFILGPGAVFPICVGIRNLFWDIFISNTPCSSSQADARGSELTGFLCKMCTSLLNVAESRASHEVKPKLPNCSQLLCLARCNFGVPTDTGHCHWQIPGLCTDPSPWERFTQATFHTGNTHQEACGTPKGTFV